MVVFTMNSISIRMKCVFLVLLLHLSVGSRWVALDQCHDLMKPVPALNFGPRSAGWWLVAEADLL
jgi:hypothetical protein